MELQSIKKVFIYLRKSRDEDNEGVDILDNHKRQLLEICKKNKWHDVKIFEEIGSGSSIEKRPVFQSMLKEIGDGMTDLVLVMDLDRISRGTATDWDTIKEVFRKATTFLMNAMGQIYDYNNLDQEFMGDLLAIFSRYELQTIKKRYARGKVAAHAKGKWVSGTPPFGYVYNRDTGYLDIDEERAEIFKLIVSWSLAGRTDGEISKELNKMGVKSIWGNKFSPTAVYRMLTNPTYKGEIVLRRATGSHKDNTYKPLPEHEWVVTKDTHEPLISYEDFERVKELLAARNITPVNARRRVHALSGLVYCPCGTLRSITVPQNGQLSPYIKPCRKCKNGGVVSQPVIDYIEYETSELLDKVKQGSPEIIGRTKEIKIRIKTLKNKLKALDSASEKLLDLYMDGLIKSKAEYVKRLDKIEEDKKATTFDLDKFTNELHESKGDNIEDHVKKLEEFSKAWGKGEVPTEDQNRLAKLFINKVILERKGKEIAISIEYK